jgi:hypothetical protein
MNDMPKHAIPAAPEERRDHIWVLVIIAACALLEVWASWLGIGAVSGFPKLGRMTTGWILPVTTEAYWGYALYAWLAGSPGPRSRRFAMATAVIMFILSLGGQEAGHLLASAHRAAPWYVVALITPIPLIALGLIAVLVHLRQADREEATQTAHAAAEAARLAEEERIAADERTALRAQLAAERQAHATGMRETQERLAAERTARIEAQQEAALRAGAQADRKEALTALEAEQDARHAAETAHAETVRLLAEVESKAARLTRKLEAAAGPQATRKAARKSEAAGRADREPAAPAAIDARVKALEIVEADPDISGAELARKCGMSERWGQDRKKEYAEMLAGLRAGGAAEESA